MSFPSLLALWIAPAFARLVRCVLGPTAVSDRKLLYGKPLVILGIEVTLSQDSARYRPDGEKLHKWLGQIDRVLEDGLLHSGEASKMAGALQWAAQHTFRRLGRAMLSPLFSQQHRRANEIDAELRLALCWWREVLSLSLCEKRQWKEVQSPPVHLYCDARSTPPRVAAVLFA